MDRRLLDWTFRYAPPMKPEAPAVRIKKPETGRI
jgi:hypothetical protein